MIATYTLPQGRINLAVISQPVQGRITIDLRHATEQPTPGQPGKQVGEIFFTTLVGASPMLIVSLGSADKVMPEIYRQAGGTLASYLLKNKVTDSQIALDLFKGGADSAELKAFLEGLLLGEFRFARYKNNSEDSAAVTISLTCDDDGSTVEKLVQHVQKITAAVNLSRDWAHEPANVINPVSLADRVKELASANNLKVTILDDQDLERMGAGAIHAVGKGSKTPSRLIIMEYPGTSENVDPVIVIGKAITFDTGGYSIKGSDNVQGMKYDKSGAMTAIATVIAAAQLGLKNPVTAVVAAAENMISGEAYRPDDIIRSLSGKTIEIISTDAEGRLVLADALTYTQKNLKPKAMIDLATLTGGVVIALGKVRAGLMSNNDNLADALFKAGENVYERLWRMPLDEAYFEQIKGDDADIRNSGGREASTIIGGTFLNQFVDPSVPWAHIDIAGVATTSKDLPYCQKGATGFGVRLLIDYLKSLE